MRMGASLKKRRVIEGGVLATRLTADLSGFVHPTAGFGVPRERVGLSVGLPLAHRGDQRHRVRPGESLLAFEGDVG